MLGFSTCKVGYIEHVLRLGRVFWPCWLGLLIGWVAVWLESYWACVIKYWGCAIFDVAGT